MVVLVNCWVMARDRKIKSVGTSSLGLRLTEDQVVTDSSRHAVPDLHVMKT